jgi:hypothetical protein
MRIEEIVDLQSLADKSQTDALKRQSKQIKVKKAKLAADKAQRRVVATQQRLRKAKTT